MFGLVIKTCYEAMGMLGTKSCGRSKGVGMAVMKPMSCQG